MIFLPVRPGPSSGTLHPTHLLPRHTSFIMTVIIDYAPTSNPFSLPSPLLPLARGLPPLLRFHSSQSFALRRLCRRRRHRRRARTTHITATRGYTKRKGERARRMSVPLLLLSFHEGIRCGDPLRIFETGYRDSSFSAAVRCLLRRTARRFDPQITSIVMMSGAAPLAVGCLFLSFCLTSFEFQKWLDHLVAT